MYPADQITLHAKPRLTSKARAVIDRVTARPLLLYPEGVLSLNDTAKSVLELCDGQTSVAEIVSRLESRYRVGEPAIGSQVLGFLARLQTDLLVLGLPPLALVECPGASPIAGLDSLPRPIGLLAELTYRCPLRCPYCSNPTRISTARGELDVSEWCRVLCEAADLGVLHVHFSGGEPLLFPELRHLVEVAQRAGLYTNLITSAVGLSAKCAEELRVAGLDSVQISFQADEAGLADAIAGNVAHRRKVAAAGLVRALGFPLTCNFVLHRANIGRVAAMIELAEHLGAERLELASAQFYGWAARNRAALLPAREQVDRAEPIIRAAAERLHARIKIVYVRSDYYGDRPKACMNGWGRRQLTVNPLGDVLPCPTAGAIRSLEFDNVRDWSLAHIWRDSAAFQQFRGTAWMPEPCRSCELRDVDYGGCRCQAALLTGNPANTDPACALSPHRHVLTEIVQQAELVADGVKVGDPIKTFQESVRFRQHPFSAVS